jgi:hypothetical protein
MSQKSESLELSFKLACKNIFPSLRRGFITDYTAAKSKLKKIKLQLMVDEIDEIIVLMLSKLSNIKSTNKEPDKKKHIEIEKELAYDILRKK